MKERSKSKMAELLLEELLDQLKERVSLREKLGDLTSLPVEELIEQLLADFEAVVEKRRLQNIEESRSRKKAKFESASFDRPLFEPTVESQPSGERMPEPVEIAPPPVVESPVEEAPQSKKAPKEDPPPLKKAEKLVLDFPPISLRLPLIEPITPARSPKREQTAVEKNEPELFAREKTPPSKEKEMPKQERYDDRPVRLPKVVEEKTDIQPDGDFDDEAAPEEQVEIAEQPRVEVTHQKQTTMPKLPVEFVDNDYVYLHAVASLPEGEVPSAQPFMLEEKGIDGKSFAFALDYEGLRLYLSKFNPEMMSVSKKGVLLLGKQETLQFQGVHESIVNDLRMHGMLLPFKFGSVARGKDRLLSMIDAHLDDIREGIAGIAATKWWTLNLYVLDSRIAQLVGSQATNRGREREQQRASYVQTGAAKVYDVKTLERILQKEKKIAETIHAEVEKHAERSDIDSMVGLGSGSSDDWKLILKASYEVTARNLPHFNRMVTDLQYHHIMFDLMLSLTGDVEAYSFE